MEPFINDGDLAYGSRLLAITPPGGGSPVSFIADDISFTDPSKVVRAYGHKGAPRGSVGQDDFKTGSGTLQLETAATALPKKGATFVENFANTEDEDDELTYWITEIGSAENSGDLRKIPFSFSVRINTPA